jgi:hypothetical protein
LAELQKLDQDAMVRRSLLSLLPKFPVSPEIHTINLSHIQVEHLIRALHHPSYIMVHGAAQLLAAAGEGREEVASLLFSSNDEQLLHILVLAAGRLWEAEARPLLMKRLDQGFTPGNWWLIEELPYPALGHGAAAAATRLCRTRPNGSSRHHHRTAGEGGQGR